MTTPHQLPIAIDPELTAAAFDLDDLIAEIVQLERSAPPRAPASMVRAASAPEPGAQVRPIPVVIGAVCLVGLAILDAVGFAR